MRRLAVLLLLVSCVAMASGCSTVAKGVLHEVFPYKARTLELSGGSAAWTSYGALEFGPITAGSVGNLTPSELMTQIVPNAEEEVEKSKLFRRVGGSGAEKTLVFSGDVIDFDDGSVTRVVGFGGKPFITLRATLVDKASGKVLVSMNLQSIVESMRDWKPLCGKGVGKGVVEYLKKKGMQKLSDDNGS